MWSFLFSLGLICLPLFALLLGDFSELLALAFEIGIAVVFSAIVALFSKFLDNERDFRKVFMDVGRVDAVLAERAKKFTEACNEEELQKKHGYRALVGDIDDPVKGFEQIQGRISEQKKYLLNQKERFWEAHGLAKKLGYRVFISYMDYLPKPAKPAA